MRLESMISVGRFFARLLYGFEAHGIENIPATGPCVLGGNHPGKLLSDPFVMLAIVPRRMPIIIAPEREARIVPSRKGHSLAEVLSVLLLRSGLRSARAIRIGRGGSTPVSRNMAMLKALEEGQAVFLEVEGEVSWDGRMKPPRSGAAWMALRSGAPFVPIGLIGTYDVWPRWAASPQLTGKVIVNIGKPVHLSETIPEWIDDEMLQDANDRIRSEIEALIS